jgi:hypothetical protein
MKDVGRRTYVEMKRKLKEEQNGGLLQTYGRTDDEKRKIKTEYFTV